MQNITSILELKNAIRLLEAEQTLKGQQIKEQLAVTYQRFRPANLIKSNLMDIVTSKQLIFPILYAGLGLASGYLSKKLIVGSSVSIVRKLLGSALQMGVSAYSAKRAYAVQSNGQSFFKRLFRRKDSKSKIGE